VTKWSWQGSAVLFDLDGTLIDSTQSVLRAWRAAADELGVPFAVFEPYVHGIPAPQAFALSLPDAAPADIDRLSEQLLVRQSEDTGDVVAIDGVLAALDDLPTRTWAIVTSGDRRLASARIRAAGIPPPRVLVTAEDVFAGKPDPAPYLLGASRLAAAPEHCLVFEDAWPGVRAGVAAGMPVVGVLSSAERLDAVVHTVSDFSELDFDVDRAGLTVRAR
jgi:mannitol-1-/sugar-/sorbitol-6-phosphatase